MPETYVPVLRNDQNEQRVIRNFNRSTLSGSPGRSVSMAPLVEIKDEDDLDQLGQYRDAGEPLMVELPRYLASRSNKYQESISELIEEYGGVNGFYRSKLEHDQIPVISGSIDPVDYTEYLPLYQEIREDFNQVGIRLMVRKITNTFTGDQRATLEELGESVRDDEIVLFDVVDSGVREELIENLAFLSGVFSTNMRVVLNVFDAFDDQPDNQSPHIADEIGAEAFGDFGINQRFKSKGGGWPDTVQIRHYHPNHSTVEYFEGNDYEDAAGELTDWPEWDPTHCEGCRQAERTSNRDANTWARIRMEHYLNSVVEGEI